MQETATIPNPALVEWGARQQRLSRWYVPLHNLIFGKDRWRYLFYRTRYTVAVTFLRAVLHIIEFSLIIYALPTMLYPIMLLRMLSLSLEGSWWGVTDAMRHQIRRLRRQQNLQRIQQEIMEWLSLATGVALTVFIAAVALALWSASVSLPYAALIVAIGFQTAMRILSRTFYSGAYALRRVFLPIEFIVGPEIFIFILGLLLHESLGEWSVALCVALSSVVVSAVSYYSIRRVTDFLRVTPPSLFTHGSLTRIFKRYRLSTLVLPALAMLGIRLHDVLLVAGLQLLAERGTFAQKLLFAVYLIMPLLRGSMHWSQVMYFDLSRYSLDVFARFRYTLEKVGVFYSLFLAALFCVLAIAILALFAPVPLDAAIRIIVGYMLAASVLGFVQISLFARRRYMDVIILCLVQYATLWPLLVWKIGWLRIWQGLTLSLAVPAVLGWIQLRRPWVPPRDALAPYFPWVAAVCRRLQPTRLLRLDFHRETKHTLQLAVANDITRIGEEDITVCIHDHSVLVATSWRKDDIQLLYQNLLELGGGFVTSIQEVQADNGKAACHEAQVNGLLPKLEGEAAATVSLEALITEFKQHFPDGIVHRPMQDNPALLAQTNDEDRRNIMQQAYSGTGLDRKKRSKEWFVTTVYDDPYIAMMFLVPKESADSGQRQYWRQRVEQFNLAQLKQRMA